MKRDDMDSEAKKYIADLREELLLAETRCGSLQSKIDSMKMVYNDMHPETDKFSQITSSTEACNDLPLRNSISVSSNVTNRNDNCYNFLKEAHEVDCPSEPDAEGPTYDLRSTTKLTVDVPQSGIDDDGLDIDGTVKSELSTITPKTYILPKINAVLSSKSPPHEDDGHDDHWQHPYQQSLAEYSTGPQDVNSKRSLEQLLLEDRNKYTIDKLTSVKKNAKKDATGNENNVPKPKHKNNSTNGRMERRMSSTLSTKNSSVAKLDEFGLSKFKRRKGKLRCSSSKSTVTTKDTCLVGRKESKKRKFKTAVINTRNSGALKAQKQSSEVVEIYHNAAAKTGSTSIVSSKHSKLDRPTNRLLSYKDVNEKSKRDGNYYQHSNDINYENRRESPRESFPSKNTTEVTHSNTVDHNCKSEVTANQMCTVDKYNSCEYQQAIIEARNYEMPTLASKLKRANRSYFNRFNFRNIPFVVGTSVTPSHNLGLNIQQVLSIMKTRQPATSGITPLLIRKVSRGMKPVSVLMDEINDQYTKLSEVNSQMTYIYQQKENSLTNKIDIPVENVSNQNSILKYAKLKQSQNLQRRSVKDQALDENSKREKDTLPENQLGKYQPNGYTVLTNENRSQIKILKPFASQQQMIRHIKVPNALSKIPQDGVCDGDFYSAHSIARSQSSKGIREVLVNLHDQFEEMNKKYEKLQAKTEKSADKTLENEILSLEKDLNAKEDEINAVVSLYKEVMALKHQMKLLHEKSSFVCISTEIPGVPNKAYSALPLTPRKPFGSSHHPGLYCRKGNTVSATREPSTSIRLAGLLRQIQSFQKQLKLTS